jgi:hypothetical protein
VSSRQRRLTAGAYTLFFPFLLDPAIGNNRQKKKKTETSTDFDHTIWLFFFLLVPVMIIAVVIHDPGSSQAARS